MSLSEKEKQELIYWNHHYTDIANANIRIENTQTSTLLNFMLLAATAFIAASGTVAKEVFDSSALHFQGLLLAWGLLASSIFLGLLQVVRERRQSHQVRKQQLEIAEYAHKCLNNEVPSKEYNSKILAMRSTTKINGPDFFLYCQGLLLLAGVEVLGISLVTIPGL